MNSNINKYRLITSLIGQIQKKRLWVVFLVEILVINVYKTYLCLCAISDMTSHILKVVSCSLLWQKYPKRRKINSATELCKQINKRVCDVITATFFWLKAIFFFIVYYFAKKNDLKSFLRIAIRFLRPKPLTPSGGYFYITSLPFWWRNLTAFQRQCLKYKHRQKKLRFRSENFVPFFFIIQLWLRRVIEIFL